MGHVHVESPHHVKLMQCTADILTCALRNSFLDELATRFRLIIPNATVLQDALVFLKTTIYHWEVIPLTAQFVYHIHSHWCGKGWKIPVVIIRGTLDVPDIDESELSTSEEDFSSGSDAEDLDNI
jgi:hypothetical protein